MGAQCLTPPPPPTSVKSVGFTTTLTMEHVPHPTIVKCQNQETREQAFCMVFLKIIRLNKYPHTL